MPGKNKEKILHNFFVNNGYQKRNNQKYSIYDNGESIYDIIPLYKKLK